MSRIITIVYLFLGFIIGYHAHTFLSGATNLPAPANWINKPASLEKQVHVQQQKFQQKIDSISSENVFLQKQVTQSKLSLSKVKRVNAELERQVSELIIRGYEITDTVQLLANCDTAKQTMQLLISISNKKDSLCDQVVTGLEKQVQNKDNTLDAWQEQYHSLRYSFNSSIAQQKALLEENNQYKQVFKRQKLRNGFISAGAVILTGIVAYSLLW